MAARRWEISAEDFTYDGEFHETAFREAVREALMEVEAIGHRLGYAVTAAPVRHPDTYETVGWKFQTGVVPTARYAGPEEPQEPVETLAQAVEPEPEGDAQNGSDEPAEGDGE